MSTVACLSIAADLSERAVCMACMAALTLHRTCAQRSGAMSYQVRPSTSMLANRGFTAVAIKFAHDSSSSVRLGCAACVADAMRTVTGLQHVRLALAGGSRPTHRDTRETSSSSPPRPRLRRRASCGCHRAWRSYAPRGASHTRAAPASAAARDADRKTVRRRDVRGCMGAGP